MEGVMDIVKVETDCLESTSWSGLSYDVKQEIDPLSVMKWEAEDEPTMKTEGNSSFSVISSQQILVKRDENNEKYRVTSVSMKTDIDEDTALLGCTRKSRGVDSCTGIEEGTDIFSSSELQLSRYNTCNESHYGNRYSQSSDFAEPAVKCNETVTHTDTQGRSYKCDICGEFFRRREEFIAHARIHGLKKSFKCEMCGKGFSTKNTYVTHIRIHTGEKPFSCEICGKLFRDSGNLTVHLRFHSGEKRYECKFCKKQFYRTTELLRHERIHTGEKPYKCNFCGKGFAEVGNLTTHMRVHTGEKPYNCETCGKGFSKRGNLLTHVRIHSGEKPFRCPICGKHFSQYGHLSAHMRIHTR
ncbi:zinc finger protein 239-like [Periplaneta americana]|uniref:zinc finger protein 239-like n=1 Tax=Periplaneta americana TaxID=6978 RepID=UPI0037E75AE0